jgi:S-adenosylmethionine:tRNA ribosyltransferase-isomerase
MPTIDQFDYNLPHRLIAQKPAEPRDSSKLLVVDRETGQIEHHHFSDLPSLLGPNDVIVRNNTKVIPARILGQKTTGGQVELLLIKRLHLEQDQEIWECLTKPGLKPGQVVSFDSSPLLATCTTITNYTREIAFNLSHSALFEELTKIGHTPIPPYITDWSDNDEPKLRQLYQTTFAKIQGSAAAPTAGLHFTPELDQQLLAKGVQIEEITLHVGLGTFLSVKTQDITQHDMHSEWFTLPEAVAERLNKAKHEGKRIIAVGTTSTRVLETCANDNGQLTPQSGETQLYVYPPRKFKLVDAMITNFHEPKTTLIMLASAFSSAPNTSHEFKTFWETPVGKAYQEAMNNNYRFLSFGDAMLII